MIVCRSLYCRPSTITKIAIALAFAFSWATPYTYAQSATATLSGVVEDESGSVITGAEVVVLNPNTMQERRTTTNRDGYFTVTFLQPANYTVKVKRDGFAPAEIMNVVLNINDQLALRVRLRVANVGETISVVGEASTIRTDAAVGIVVDRQFVANLPLNGRSFQSLITLMPGVVNTAASDGSPGQFSVNGQRANANYFTVDGVSANISSQPTAAPGQPTNGSLPGLTTFGGTNNLVSIDALQEFRIETSTYSAERGRSPGGQIALVTRSGTNEPRGSLFEYFRNEALDANDWFANRNGTPKAPLRQNQFGGVIGGPIIIPRFGGGSPHFYDGRNRSFFFFSYEGLRLRLPQFTTTRVPTLSLRQHAPAALQPLLNAFPRPNGRDLGNGLAEFSASYSNPSTFDSASIRIDQIVSNKLTMFGRYNKAPSKTVSRSTSSLSQLNTISGDTQTLTVGATFTLTPRLTNELLANYSNNAGNNFSSLDDFGGAAPFSNAALFPPFASPERSVASVSLSFPGLSPSTVGVGNLQSTPMRQINFVDNFSMTSGAHQLKFGVDYRRLFPIYGPRDYNLNLTFADQTAIINGIVSRASISTNVEARPIYNNFSAFGQDAWKFTPRLTLNLGLRWELNPAPSEANGNDPPTVIGLDNPSTMTLAPHGTPLWKTTYANFAPRIGAAYQLIKTTGYETALRGGFGIFYDLGSSQGAGGFTGVPFTASKLPAPTNVPFPLPAAVAAAPAPGLTVPYGLIYAFDSDLRLPYTLQWNLAAEQSFGSDQRLSVSYVAAVSRQLLKLRQLQRPNPDFQFVNATTNGTTSDYHSLQLQFQRRLSRGLQALASYTWSHAIDEVSSDNLTTDQLRGDAGFDVRHSFSTAITYNLPTPRLGAFTSALLRDWAIDSIFKAQSATPLSVSVGTLFNSDGTNTSVHPNLLLGTPIHIDDPTAPGGRRFNNKQDPSRPGCFGPFCLPPSGQQGNLGRNTLRALPLYQIDFAIRRQIKLTERLNLQFRAEAFNLFNHPNFGGIDTNVRSARFGEPTMMLGRSLRGLSSIYQIGGPRSLQFALRFQY
jgi:Carboxypeptidase regulatory-like domain/TonB dependent receptor-like, beta-barrel